MVKSRRKKAEINLNKKKKKPGISASIYDFALTLIHEEKLLFAGIASAVFFLLLVVFAAFQLSSSLTQQKEAKKEKERVKYEVVFWEKVVQLHPDYRDGYFMLAVLEYQLGEASQSKSFLSKAMEIDPNFTKGKELEQMLK